MASKWRVGERQAQGCVRTLSWHAVSDDEAHPLAGEPAVVREDEAATRYRTRSRPGTQDSYLSGDRREEALSDLVELPIGDVDPLEAMKRSVDGQTVGLEVDRALLTAADTVLTEKRRAKARAAATSCSVKQQWKRQAGQLLDGYADHTVTIKADMLQVKELESEISFAKTGNCHETNDVCEALDSATIRARLKQLEHGLDHGERRSSAREELPTEISQSQYVAKVKEMQKRLIASWEQGQKVEALRIAIKCVKLLADTDTAPQLYPCVFVLVSEVLNAFGQLVFDRVCAQASEDDNGQPLAEPLGAHFTSSDVNVQASETCRNWFYKSACIRELLPRMYMMACVDHAFLACLADLIVCLYATATSRPRCSGATAFFVMASMRELSLGCLT